MSLRISAATADSIQVISFNSGLLKFGMGTTNTTVGLDGVGCVDSRVIAQKQTFEKLYEQKKTLKTPFILGLQEVWSRKHQDDFASQAERLGLQVTKYPGDNRGLMTITSGEILDESFILFPCDSFGANRGILVTII